MAVESMMLTAAPSFVLSIFKCCVGGRPSKGESTTISTFCSSIGKRDGDNEDDEL